MKALFRVYAVYGGGGSERLEESYTIEDTPENRAEYMVDYLSGEDELEDYVDFINGDTNTAECEGDMVSYDSPTGYSFEVITRDDALAQAKETYDKAVAEIMEKLG